MVNRFVPVVLDASKPLVEVENGKQSTRCRHYRLNLSALWVIGTFDDRNSLRLPCALPSQQGERTMTLCVWVCARTCMHIHLSLLTVCIHVSLFLPPAFLTMCTGTCMLVCVGVCVCVNVFTALTYTPSTPMSEMFLITNLSSIWWGICIACSELAAWFQAAESLSVSGGTGSRGQPDQWSWGTWDHGWAVLQEGT